MFALLKNKLHGNRKRIMQSIFDSYGNKLKRPFIRSFALSFMQFNWKVFLVLLYTD